MHAAAKVVSVFMILGVFTSFSAVWADETSKAVKLRELMELSGMMQIMEQARTKNKTQALQAKPTIMKQLRTDFLKDDTALWEFFEREYQKFIDSLEPKWTPEEAVQKYIDLYGAKMTEEEIDAVLAFERSAVGKKWTTVSNEVALIWFEYLDKGGDAQFHEGLQNFVGKLRTFLAEKKKKQKSAEE